MDPLTVIGFFAAGIGGLWWYLKTTTDNRINDLKDAHKTDREDWDRERATLTGTIAKLEAKVETQNSILAQNTTALEQSNANTAILIDLIQQGALAPERGP